MVAMKASRSTVARSGGRPRGSDEGSADDLARQQEIEGLPIDGIGDEPADLRDVGATGNGPIPVSKSRLIFLSRTQSGWADMIELHAQ